MSSPGEGKEQIKDCLGEWDIFRLKVQDEHTLDFLQNWKNFMCLNNYDFF